MILLLERMRAALDAHDLDTFVEFFREDYVGERPRHPGAEMSSREDVRRNWAEIIRDVPDLRVDVPAAVEDGDKRSGASGAPTAPLAAARCSSCAA